MKEKEQGIQNQNTEFREILTNDNSMVIIDLDGTVKEEKNILWQDGITRRIYPETLASFITLKKNNISLGIATDQSFLEVNSLKDQISELINKFDRTIILEIVDWPIICEGGTIVVRSGKSEIMASKNAMEERSIILSWLSKNILPLEDGWGLLQGVNIDESTYIQLPKDIFQGVAMISLWKKGSSVSEDSLYINKYLKIQEKVERQMVELGINDLMTYEVGNRTLRIVPKNIDKSYQLRLLLEKNQLNGKNYIFFCDGQNDITLSKFIKNMGGKVVAVSNAVGEIHEVADYSCKNPCDLGFSEVIKSMFPEVYQQSLQTIISSYN